MKPVVNLDELEWQSHSHGDAFAAKGKGISQFLGAQRLGYRTHLVAPGKKAWPFHHHHANEEMFYILEGRGTLRFGDQCYPLRPGDFIAAPAGGPETAHQIINDGDEDLHYLCVSTMVSPEVVEYPDSGKFSASVTVPIEGGERVSAFRHVGKTAAEVDYWTDES